MDMTFEENDRDALDRVRAALARMDAGTYGICDSLRRRDTRRPTRGRSRREPVHSVQGSRRDPLDLRHPGRVFAAVASIILVVDQLSKAVVRANLVEGQTSPLWSRSC